MKKITKLPLNWPTDKRTRRSDLDGTIFITHPDRAAHWSKDGRTWEEVRPALPENVTPIDSFRYAVAGAE